MAAHERFEGRRFTTADEAFQELSIRPFAGGLQKRDSANVLDDRVHWGRQVPGSAGGNAHPLPMYYPHEGGLIRDVLPGLS